MLSKLGQQFERSYVGSLVVMTADVITSPFRHQGNPRATFHTFLNQVYFTGVEVLPHITILALVIGAITILQAVTLMPKLGSGDAFGGVMVAVVVRELGPLVTALFVAGRTGSALSTYIGNMRVLEEIDALKAMGINPVHYQIMPAFFATLLSLFCLTLIFNLVATFGGFAIVAGMHAWFPEMFSARFSLTLFVEQIFQAMGFMDAFFAIAKPLLYGVFVCVIASHHGLEVGKDVRQVPRATRMSVVRTFVGILICDMILAFPFMLQVKENIIL